MRAWTQLRAHALTISECSNSAIAIRILIVLSLFFGGKSLSLRKESCGSNLPPTDFPGHR
jgi:hypothetical protein